MLAIDWHWHVTTDVDVGVDDDDVDIDLVLALVYLDVHLVYNLTYVGLDYIWSPGFTLQINFSLFTKLLFPGLTLQVDFDSIKNVFLQKFFQNFIQNRIVIA